MIRLYNDNFISGYMVETDYKSLTFSGGERHIDLTSYDVDVILAQINTSDDLIDLMLIDDILRSNNNYNPHLIIPYLPYARQDKNHTKTQPFSLKVFSKMINSLKYKTLEVWDVHSNVSLSLFNNIKNYSISNIFLDVPSNGVLISELFNDEYILVCPDKGAINRTNEIKLNLEMKKIIYCEKNRDPSTGYIKEILINSNENELQNSTCIICDDICDGGMTFKLIGEKLKKMGVKNLILFVTHGIFSKGVNKLNDFDKIYTTNSMGVININQRFEIKNIK